MHLENTHQGSLQSGMPGSSETRHWRGSVIALVVISRYSLGPPITFQSRLTASKYRTGAAYGPSVISE
jgi:hypothetical protein